MKYHYVYRITNKVCRKHYYGVRSSNNHPKQDIGIQYFSSSYDKDFIKDQKENSREDQRSNQVFRRESDDQRSKTTHNSPIDGLHRDLPRVYGRDCEDIGALEDELVEATDEVLRTDGV